MGRLLMPPLAAFFLLAVIVFQPFLLAGAQESQSPAYVALGDSIAFGVGAQEPRTGGYVGLVHGALQTSERYRERGLDLRNFAVPGATTADLLIPGGQLDSALAEIQAREDTSSPDDDAEIISVNIGGNDLLQLATPSSPCFQNAGSDACIEEFGGVLSSVQRNLSQVLQRLREEAPEAGIFVVDLYNPYSGTGDSRETIADLAVQNLNGIIGANAANEELNVRLASIFQLFRGRGLQWISADGIHPNENGHRVIGEVLLATIDNREPQIPAELLAQTPAPAASPGIPELGADEGSETDWLAWALVPVAFVAGTVLAGAYFWARGRA